VKARHRDGHVDKDDNPIIGSWRNSNPISDVVARLVPKSQSVGITFHHGNTTLTYNDVFCSDQVVLSKTFDEVKRHYKLENLYGKDDKEAKSNIERVRRYMRPLLLYMIGEVGRHTQQILRCAHHGQKARK
jgi:hypothetical protein